MGIVEVGLFFVVATAATFVIAYWLIRLAVRDGVVDGQRKLEAERVRTDLGLGPERGPNSATRG